MSMTNDFEPLRQFLIGVAYSMLGSLAEAEDVVQDAFLRWSATDRQTVDHPRAFLARVVSRLYLDRMKSATSRREHYVGTWLPEPPAFCRDRRCREKLTEAFAAATAQQGIEPIAKLLADHAILYQDGGGKRPAARHPIRGKTTASFSS